MADNIPITAGAGTVVAADDIASVFYQRVKLSLGADGAAVDAVAGAGVVGTGVQRMTLASDDPAVASLGIMDDWDESDRAKVNIIAGQAGIAAGAGAVAATVPRVTLASDDPGVASLGIMDDWDNAASDGASVSGDVAHDTADAGEPVKIGGKAIAALSAQTLVSANDRTNAYADLDGAMIVRGNFALGDLVSGSATNTDGASTEVLAAGAAGIKHYITDVTIANTSASVIVVELKDNATTKWVFPVPGYSGVVKSFISPLVGTAATAWNFDPSAAATTIYCSVSGFKSKV